LEESPPWNGDAQSLQAILSMEGANKKKASEKNTTIAFETRKKEIAFLCINSLTVYGCKKFCLKIKSKTKLLENQAPWSSLVFLPLLLLQIYRTFM